MRKLLMTGLVPLLGASLSPAASANGTISGGGISGSAGEVAITTYLNGVATNSGQAGTYNFPSATDAQAREALATMTVNHRDATDPGKLYLYNAVQFAQYNANNAWQPSPRHCPRR